MGSEILLYGYGIVCISMIVFNIVYNIVMRGSDRRLNDRIEKFIEIIAAQLEGIRNGKEVSRKHIKFIERSVSRVGGLMAFDTALGRHLEKSDDALEKYLFSLREVFIRLAGVYERRESLQTAYFAYVLGNEKLRDYLPAEGLQRSLISYTTKDSLYCRVNALRALYSFGNPKAVADAVTACDRKGAFLHEKILQDGLLTFRGDHDELMKLLWGRLDSFKESTKVAVLNYIRFKTDSYKNEMFEIMTDESAGKELRLSAIRYFGRYTDERARKPLVEFVSDKNPVNWEYAAISASSLAFYDGDDIKEALIEAMHSLNWYVRYNASVSLEAKGVRYEDIAGRVENDRYASEMLKYRLKENNTGVTAV